MWSVVGNEGGPGSAYGKGPEVTIRWRWGGGIHWGPSWGADEDVTAWSMLVRLEMNGRAEVGVMCPGLKLPVTLFCFS
jgi:hypothetical protein